MPSCWVTIIFLAVFPGSIMCIQSMSRRGEGDVYESLITPNRRFEKSEFACITREACD